MSRNAGSTIAPERVRSATALRIWPQYLLVVAATCATLLAMYFGLLVGLDRTGNLPPPAIVNSSCSDEKIQWMRDHAPDQPNLLVVGSSVAWRNVDSAEFTRRDPAVEPLNGASCGLKANQTEFLTNYLLGRFPSVQTVVAVIVPEDFSGCDKVHARFFDPDAVDEYAFQRQWKYGFYFRYFDMISLVRNAFTIGAMRSGRNEFDSLVMTRFGDAPLYTHKDRGAFYGPFAGYDASCFAALHRLAETVTSSGRRFVVATSPLDPDWFRQYDPDGAVRDRLVAGVRSAVEGTGTQVWDGSRAFAADRSAFTDAIHLKSSGAQQYSALLADALDAKQARD